jgi:hypothetical protein
MNPFIASGILLILRWLQFLGSRKILGDFPEQARILAGLLDDTQRYSDRLTAFSLAEHQMTDTGKQVM